MRIISKHPPKAYMGLLKRRMGGHCEFGQERFTGFFLGSCFTVIYHSGYEWNRRITNQKNTAVGFVRSRQEGSEVCFITLKGMLGPSQFLAYTIFFTAIVLIAAAGYDPDAMLEASLMGVLISLVTMLICAPISALIESFTEKSQEGELCLHAMLRDPADPFSYLNNRYAR